MRVAGLWFMVHGLRFMVYGLGFRAHYSHHNNVRLGFRVWGLVSIILIIVLHD